MRFSLTALMVLVLAACGGKTEVVTEATDASAADASAGSAGSGGAQDAATEPAPEAAFDGALWEQCFGADGKTPESALKSCGAGGCVIKQHELDCCGTMLWFGVSKDNEASFDACEAAWREHLGECNCPAGIPKTEQPQTEVTDIAQVGAQCMNCTMQSCVCMTFPK